MSGREGPEAANEGFSRVSNREDHFSAPILHAPAPRAGILDAPEPRSGRTGWDLGPKWALEEIEIFLTRSLPLN